MTSLDVEKNVVQIRQKCEEIGTFSGQAHSGAPIRGKQVKIWDKSLKKGGKYLALFPDTNFVTTEFGVGAWSLTSGMAQSTSSIGRDAPEGAPRSDG